MFNKSLQIPASMFNEVALQTAYVVLGSVQYHRHDEALDLWNNLQNNKIMPLEKIIYKGFFEELLKHLPLIGSHHWLLIERFGKERVNSLYEHSYEVDVSEAFGRMFTKFILDYGRAPEVHEVQDIIKTLVDELISESELKNNQYRPL